MVRNSNSSEPAPGSGHAPRVDDQPAAGEAAICSRMEAARHLPSAAGCAAVCPVHRPGGAGGESPPCLLCEQAHTLLDVEHVHRVALMVSPQAHGDVIDQVWEAISTIRAVVNQQTLPMTVTSQTIFLRRADDEPACRRLFEAYFGDRMPVTNFVVQPPCGGAALAIEAWALGGEGVEVEFIHPGVVSIAYEGLRWVYVSGISPPANTSTIYAQSKATFEETARLLELAGASYNNVVRTWLYLGGITELEQGTERYRELNRARTDFFAEQQAMGRMNIQRDGRTYYPASTGIGMAGQGLVISCMTLQTDRDDVRLLPLENPQQTSAFDYAPSFSAKSPKFSRAMAVVIGDYVTTWISGTASILNSETVYPGDIEKQTMQTIDNIQALISPENFARQGIAGGGASLNDLAKIRVYVKRAEDFERCRAVCEQRFGAIPAVYAQADVCRPDLLMEIEGVAFSSLNTARTG